MPLPPDIVSVSVSPSTIYGQFTGTGTVTITSIQGGDTTVSLYSSDASLTVPATMTVLAGNLTGTFGVTTTNPTSDKIVTVSAELISTKNCSVTVKAINLVSLSLSPTTVVPTATSTGTVTIDHIAPTGGFSIALSSSDSHATVPATTTISRGNTSSTFTVSTTAVTGVTYATIRADFNSGFANAILTLTTGSIVKTVFCDTINVIPKGTH
jgi:hypothetical protein